MKNISQEDLIHILTLTDNGFSDIVKCNSRSTDRAKELISKLEILSFKESVGFLIRNPDLLKSPIIFDEKRLLIGYNSEEIRQFIPKLYRNRYSVKGEGRIL